MSWIRKPAIFSSSSWRGQHSPSSDAKVSTSSNSNNSLTNSNSFPAISTTHCTTATSSAAADEAISSSSSTFSPPPPPSSLNATQVAPGDSQRPAPESIGDVSSTAPTANDYPSYSFSSNGILNSTGAPLTLDTKHEPGTTVQQAPVQQQSTMSLLLSSTSSSIARNSFFRSSRRRILSNVMTNASSKTSSLIDSQAAIDSFRMHWFQAWDIMKRKNIPPGSTSVSTAKSFGRRKSETLHENDSPACVRQVGRDESIIAHDALNPHNSLSHKNVISSDDVTTVINHLDQMIQLLIQESKGLTSTFDMCTPFDQMSPESESVLKIDTSDPSHPLVSHSMVSPLLDCLLCESMLDKLLTWSVDAGEFASLLKLHQLQLYHVLITQVCPTKALLTKPIIRPMMQLLVTCSDCQPVDVEKAFVTLLNSLSQLLCQNDHLIDLFFLNDPEKNIQPSLGKTCDELKYSDKHCQDANVSPSDQSFISSTGDSHVINQTGHLSYLSPTIEPSDDSSPHIRAKLAWISDKPETRFLLFSLLIPYVHREGIIGSEARSALLSLLSLSNKSPSIAQYIAEQSDFCPVLATGLSGLYSSLPRKIISFIDPEWYQITSNEMDESPELRQFLSSFDFCDAVVTASPDSIKKQLIEFILHGFLISVIAPALHQNSLEELITATAYVELFLRHITHPDLLYAFLKFLCTESFDEVKLLATLISRINGPSKLSLVTLVLFRTMLGLCCEDVTLELILKYLLSCRHIGDTEQIQRIDDTMHYEVSCRKFLSLVPSYDELRGQNMIHSYNYYYESLDKTTVGSVCENEWSIEREDDQSSLLTGGSVSLMFHQINRPIDISQCILTSSKTHVSLLNRLLLRNYAEYLMDASYVINELAAECSYWANRYDSQYVIQCLNYSSSKNSLTNNTNSCKYYTAGSNGEKHSTGKDDAGEDEDDYAMHGSTSPPPTVESPSSSETTCTDSGVFVNLNLHCNLVNQHVENSLSSKGSNCEVNQDKISCANHEQPINRLPLANKDESSNVPSIVSSPQPLISASSNCSTIILSSFNTTRVTLDKCKKDTSFVDDETRINCLSSGCYSKSSSSVGAVSTDETASCISDVTLLLHHRNSNNCSPVTSVEELNSMAHESCALSGTGSTNGQITYDNSFTDANESILGPFLCALLTKLESMADADLMTNLQLTGLISYLCCYSIPLLRSFFLSSYITYRRDLKTFYDSLVVARNRIIDETGKLSQFDSILCASRCYLMSRDKSFNKSLNASTLNANHCISDLQMMKRYSIDLSESVPAECPSARSSVSSSSSGKRKSLKEFLFRSKGSTSSSSSSSLKDTQSLSNAENDPFHCQVHTSHPRESLSNVNKKSKQTKTTKQPLLESLDTGTGYRFINRSSIDSNISKDSTPDCTRKRAFGQERDEKVMLAALIFEEFLKELSAICHQHSVSPTAHL